MIKSKTLIATPPGFTIKEQLEDRFLTQKEFALRMEMSEKHISKLINGEVILTPDMAIRLEMVLGIEASFWLNLEARYREKIEKIKLENSMDEDIKLINNFPYNEMVSMQWIEKANSNEEKVINLRKFFEVNRLGLLFENEKINVLYRRININDKSNYFLLTWAQKAKLEARNVIVKSINIEGLKKEIIKLRGMTFLDPKIFCPKIVEIMSNYGIALIFLPHIKGTYLHGATFYDKNKIVVGLTVRGKDADKFWFSLFHEIGHIILGHINEDYYEDMELEANNFAQNILIPDDEFKLFISKNDFTERNIIEFSNKIKIDYGIVVGRLQKDGYISYSKYNNLKTKYMIC